MGHDAKARHVPRLLALMLAAFRGRRSWAEAPDDGVMIPQIPRCWNAQSEAGR